MKDFPQISEAELEVMKVLWELQQATSTQIVDKLINNSEWKPKTIHTLITRLVAKQAVVATKIDGKSYMYYPNIKEEDYKNYANESFLQKLYSGSINMMLTTFIKENRLSKQDISELRKLLDEDEEV